MAKDGAGGESHHAAAVSLAHGRAEDRAAEGAQVGFRDQHDIAKNGVIAGLFACFVVYQAMKSEAKNPVTDQSNTDTVTISRKEYERLQVAEHLYS